MVHPKFLENIVILCFERRFSKQNSVIRLKSNFLSPKNFLPTSKFLGWLRHWADASHFCKKNAVFVENDLIHSF